jgi:hypothetical protein
MNRFARRGLSIFASSLYNNKEKRRQRKRGRPALRTLRFLSDAKAAPPRTAENACAAFPFRIHPAQFLYGGI